MHRFRSQSIIMRYRIASMLFILNCILAILVPGFLLYSIVVGDRFLTIITASTGGFAALIAVVQWVISTKTRCPLCMTPVLAAKRCSKHRFAKKLFGSYRLRVAGNVLLSGSFVCPFCNEPSAMKVRGK